MKKIIQKIGMAAATMSSLILPLSVRAGALKEGLEPFEKVTELPKGELAETVANLINAALGILGIVLVIIIIYGGFLWMTAGGEEDKIKKAKNWIFGGIIGLIIIITAYAITRFVVSAILQAAQGV